MKKMVMIVVGLCFLMSAAPAAADYEPYSTKIKDGLSTMLHSPQPLIDSVKDEYEAAQFKPFGVFGGFLKGTMYSVKEFSSGLFRVLTFNMDEDNFFTNVFKK